MVPHLFDLIAFLYYPALCPLLFLLFCFLNIFVCLIGIFFQCRPLGTLVSCFLLFFLIFVFLWLKTPTFYIKNHSSGTNGWVEFFLVFISLIYFFLFVFPFLSFGTLSLCALFLSSFFLMSSQRLLVSAGIIMGWTTGCLKYPKVSDTASNATGSIHVFTHSGPDPGHMVKNRSIIGITATCKPSKMILQFIFRNLRPVGRQLLGGAMPGEMPPYTWDLLTAKGTLFPHFASTHLIITFRGCAEPSNTAIWCLSHVRENNMRHRKHDFPHTAHQANQAYQGRSAFSIGQMALAANFLSPCARWISRPKSACANIHGPQNSQFSSRMRG